MTARSAPAKEASAAGEVIAPRRKRGLFELRAPLPRPTALVLGLVAPAVVLVGWCVLTYGRIAPADFLPSPTDVVKGTIQLFVQHDLATAILVSTRRIALAFLLASALALPLGVLMGAFDPVNRFFEPIVAPLRYMPISAFIPLLILWFGIYEKQKIAFITRNESKISGSADGRSTVRITCIRLAPSVSAVCTSSSGTALIADTTTGSR